MVCGIILAAGMSSRMNAFKAMLPIGGTSFIKKIIHEMHDAGVRDIIVVTGYKHTELEEHIRDESVTCIYNDRYDRTQMLDSLKLGIAALPADCDKVLVTPVDVVLSSQEVYSKVISADGDFVRPFCSGKSGHPVLVGRCLFELIESYDGDGGLEGAIAASGTAITDVPVDDEAISLDADTPEDYRRVIRKYEHTGHRQWF